MRPNLSLLQALRALSPTDRQNRLMRVGDREIALAMMYMQNTDRGLLFDVLGPTKRKRVQEELRLHERLSVRYDDYLTAVALVRRNLDSTNASAVLGSYLRPSGRTRAAPR